MAKPKYFDIAFFPSEHEKYVQHKKINTTELDKMIKKLKAGIISGIGIGIS